jgi:hypothetical protein
VLQELQVQTVLLDHRVLKAHKVLQDLRVLLAELVLLVQQEGRVLRGLQV